MKAWQRSFDRQRRIFRPIVWPLLTASKLERKLDRRPLYALTGLFNPFERTRRHLIIYYLRIYTLLMSAQHYLDTGDSAKSKNYLRVIISRATDPPQSEKSNVQKLRTITRQALRMYLGTSTERNLHLKTKLMLAQNICIIRLLRL